LMQPQTMHAYSYVGNSPHRYADPTGLDRRPGKPGSVVAREYFDYLPGYGASAHLGGNPEVGGPFASPGDAAIDVLIRIRQAVNTHNREMGGLIYYLPSEKRFYASPPVWGETAQVSPFKSPVPKGAEIVGAYHAHPQPQIGPRGYPLVVEEFSLPDVGGSADFGITDYGTANYGSKFVHYLGTPSGKVKTQTGTLRNSREGELNVDNFHARHPTESEKILRGYE